jgi:hypothetical protein
MKLNFRLYIFISICAFASVGWTSTPSTDWGAIAVNMSRAFAVNTPSGAVWKVLSVSGKSQITVQLHYIHESQDGNSDCPFTVVFSDRRATVDAGLCADWREF